MRYPGPVRALVGLAATAAAEARRLPDRAIELPMLAVSTALQASLRAQQRYARLAARGEEVLHRQPITADPPPWARFDEDTDQADAANRQADPGLTSVSSALGDLFGTDDPTLTAHDPEPIDEIPTADEPPPPSPRTRPAATPPRPAAKKASPRATKAPAAATKKAATRKPAAKATKQAARKVTDEPPRPAGTPKTVSAPRHTPPSAFDRADPGDGTGTGADVEARDTDTTPDRDTTAHRDASTPAGD